MTNYIYWDPATFYSNVKLDFSLDSGATWNIITTNATYTNGYYPWTIPQTSSTKCLIRASNSLNTSLYDLSDAVFTIKPAITILTPNGGDVLGACTQTSITFEKSPAYSNANIEYTLNGGSSWTSLVANNNYGTANTTFTYNWSIPNLSSTNVKIRVYPTGNIQLGDSSNAALTIKKAVTIVQPAYGGTMQVGTSYPIKWKSEGISNLFDIAYTINGGTTWTNIVTAYNTATSTYNWTVPNAVSSNCKIRVRDNVNSCKEDISQQAFIISATPAPLTITYPNGDEVIQGCTLKNVTWTETGTPAGSYTLEYSVDAGATWITFATSYTTTIGSCPWYVPNFYNNSNVLVRVSATGSTTVRDVSDALFTLTKLPPTTNTVNLTSCTSVVYKTKTYTTSTIVRDTIKTATGLCDSIYNIANIIIQKNTTTQSLNYSGCQSVIYKGKTYTSSITLNDTTKTLQGCDSVYNTVYITVYNITPITNTQNFSGCKKYIFNGITYTTNTTLRDTLRSVSYCDSIYNVTNIIINTACVNYINTTFTVNMVNYLVTGNTIDTGGIRIAGNFADLGINLPNWTPTSQLSKLAKQGITDNWSITIPIPDTSINKTLYFKFVNTNWGKNEGIDFGSELKNTTTCSVNDGFGNYNRFLKLPTKDSSVSYCWERCGLCNTTNNAPIVTTGNITSKTSSMVTVGNNNLVATGGSTVFYKGLLVSTNPLPNIYNNTFNSYFHYANPTLGTYSVYIAGLYSNTQYYVRAFASNEIGTTYGSVIPFVLCDSAKRDTLNLIGCDNVIYNGNTYASSTIKRDTLKTTLGCDSIYRVANITVKPISASYQSATICADALPYTWNGNTYNAAGNYTANFTNAVGCDSTANLKLIVNALPVISIASPTNCVGTANINLTGASNALQIVWQNNGSTVNTKTPTAAAFGTTVAGGNPTSTLPNALNGPSSVFVDKNGVLYVGDLNNARIQRFAVGNLNATTVAGSGTIGVGLHQFNSPSGVIVNDSNNVYVGDFGNHRVTKWLPNANIGIVVAGGNGSTNTSNAFNGVADIFVDAANNIYVADQNNHRIQKWAPGATSGVTVAGGNGAGSANNQINLPTAVFVDAAGNVYVGDYGNKRVTKWTVGATSGVTVAGGNGAGAANNQIDLLVGLYVDAIGNVYVADQNNHRIQKWVVGATTGITVAGGNGAGSAANQFKFPKDIYIDTAGAMYIPDNWNQRVQKWLQSINTSYIPTTAGVYTAIVTNNSGCVATSNAITIGSSATPTNSVIASATTICYGEKVTFTATANNGGSSPQYQWFKNNNTVGTNANIYTDSLLNNSDSVWCVLTSNSPCATSTTAKSNVVLMNVSNTISGNIKHPTKGNIATVTAKLIGTTNNTLLASGSYSFNCLAASTIGTIRLSKNNDIAKANGVTSVDVLLIQRHILNTTKLNSPYKLIAADVDGNKAINSVDVLRMKRLILGTDTTFTSSTKGNRLWEFVDSAYVFPDTTNPFPFKDSITLNNLTSNRTNQTFIGVKLGDVNYDWNPVIARQFNANSLQLSYSINNEESRNENSIVRIPITVSNFKNIAAMQYTLHFDNKDYEFIGIENNELNIDFNEKQANKNGNIAMLWTDKNAEAITLNDGTKLFTLVLKNKRMRSNTSLEINSDITNVEAWDKDFIQRNILLNKILNSTEGMLGCEMWSFSPNPTSNFIKVNMFCKTNKNITIQLTNVQGKILLQKGFEAVKGSNVLMINLKEHNQIPTGVYYIKAIGLSGEDVKKIIVE